VTQLRAHAGQPGVPNQGQIQPLAGQIQATLDGRDAALRRGACDTGQYEQQIGSLVGSLQSALAASSQAAVPPPPSGYGAPPPAYGYPQQVPPPPPASGYPQQAPSPSAYGYPQQGGSPPAPGNAQPGAPGQAAPGAPSQFPSAGEVFSKLFDIAVDQLSKKSKKGGDIVSGLATGSQPPPAHSAPSTPPSLPGVGGFPGIPGQSNPSGYPSPPPSYSPPPPSYSSPPPSYTPPPPSYSSPPPSYTSPPSYTPPPPSYSSPPPSYTPPPPSYPAPQPSYQTAPSNPASPPSSSVFSSLPVLPSPQSPQSPVPPPAALSTLPQLQDLAKVTGTVRTEWGDAIVGAFVSVVEWNMTVTTGSDGKYVLTGPARQSVTIQVQASEYLSQTSTAAGGPCRGCDHAKHRTRLGPETLELRTLSGARRWRCGW
jgi:hypothetical protein